MQRGARKACRHARLQAQAAMVERKTRVRPRDGRGGAFRSRVLSRVAAGLQMDTQHGRQQDVRVTAAPFQQRHGLGSSALARFPPCRRMAIRSPGDFADALAADAAGCLPRAGAFARRARMPYARRAPGRPCTPHKCTRKLDSARRTIRTGGLVAGGVQRQLPRMNWSRAACARPRLRYRRARRGRPD
jgi:hypothetical protein